MSSAPKIPVIANQCVLLLTMTEYYVAMTKNSECMGKKYPRSWLKRSGVCLGDIRKGGILDWSPS